MLDFLHIKATYYNPKAKHNINIIVNDSYKLIPMPLRYFGAIPLRKEVIHERLNLFMRAEPCYYYYHHYY